MSSTTRIHRYTLSVAMGAMIAAGALLPGFAHAETLKEALSKAYRNNPALTGARAAQRATDEGVPLARANGLPDVRVTGQYNELVHRDFPTTTAPRNLTGSGQISVPIYSGGSVKYNVRAAKLNAEAGRHALRGSESSVFSSVVAAYMDVIRDSAIVTFNRQNVNALEVNLQASSDRFEVGDVTRTDVAQSESRLALARADLQNAEAQLIASKENYVALVGSAPDLLESPPVLPGLPDSSEVAVSVALTDNPDIISARKAREAAAYLVKVAKAQASVQVSGIANGSYVDYLKTERALFGTAEPNAKSAVVGAQITVPIYQGGRPAALARQSAAQEAQAAEREVEVERSVISQVRSAYASWRASEQAIVSTRKAVEAAQLSLEGVKAENSAGTRTILDILNAEQEALNARVQLVTAERNAYVAGFTLLAAMGHAEARDLNLDVGTLYDPMVNYRRVSGKWDDADFDPAPRTQAGSTAGVPTQDASTTGAPRP